MNGAHQPLHVLASGLAGHDETQEGLAVLAEHLVGGLTAGRLRQLAARVVAVHADGGGRARSPTCTATSSTAACRRARRSRSRCACSAPAGLTKDAVYLRGLRELVDHLAAGGDLDVAVAREDVPDRRRRSSRSCTDAGRSHDPLLRPRYLDDPDAQARLARLRQVTSLTALIGDTAMRIGFVVNSVATEKPEYTTTRLALAATRRGHETWLIGVDDFAHRPDGTVAAHARAARGKKHQVVDALPRRACRPTTASDEPISVDDLDVLVMRNDPADDIVERPWAVTSGVLFGQLVGRRGAPSSSTTRPASPTPSTRPTSSTSRRRSGLAR